MDSSTKPLGRFEAPDKAHEEKFGLPVVGLDAAPVGVPVVPGVPWYSNFDSPKQGADGKWRVGHGHLGKIRGGHCFCFEPVGEPDPERNHVFYDQAEEGACEGFGHSRAMSILLATGKIPTHTPTSPDDALFDGFWLYDDAQRVEGTYQPEGGSVEDGSTNRSAAAALKKWGDHPEDAEVRNVPEVIVREPWRAGVKSVGVSKYLWATSVDEIVHVLGYDASVDEIPFVNSWGHDGYPHRVYVPLEVVDRLRGEGGEFTILVP